EPVSEEEPVAWYRPMSVDQLDERNIPGGASWQVLPRAARETCAGSTPSSGTMGPSRRQIANPATSSWPTPKIPRARRTLHGLDEPRSVQNVQLREPCRKAKAYEATVDRAPHATRNIDAKILENS